MQQKLKVQILTSIEVYKKEKREAKLAYYNVNLNIFEAYNPIYEKYMM